MIINILSAIAALVALSGAVIMMAHMYIECWRNMDDDKWGDDDE